MRAKPDADKGREGQNAQNGNTRVNVNVNLTEDQRNRVMTIFNVAIPVGAAG